MPGIFILRIRDLRLRYLSRPHYFFIVVTRRALVSSVIVFLRRHYESACRAHIRFRVAAPAKFSSNCSGRAPLLQNRHERFTKKCDLHFVLDTISPTHR
jgi:hypothetical protein